MTTSFQLRPSLSAGYQRSKPIRSKRYLAFIRRQASVVSGLGPCDAAHTGSHGAGQKADDRTCIPLTRQEHDEYGRDPYGYAKTHGLDVALLTKRLNADFELEGGKY